MWKALFIVCALDREAMQIAVLLVVAGLITVAFLSGLWWLGSVL